MECANKRKMSVGSWPYWREVGKRSWSDTRQARHSLDSSPNSYPRGKVSRRRQPLHVEPKKKRRGKEKEGKKKLIKNNFETGLKRILNF